MRETTTTGIMEISATPENVNLTVVVVPGNKAQLVRTDVAKTLQQQQQ